MRKIAFDKKVPEEASKVELPKISVEQALQSFDETIQKMRKIFNPIRPDQVSFLHMLRGFINQSAENNKEDE